MYVYLSINVYFLYTNHLIETSNVISLKLLNLLSFKETKLIFFELDDAYF